MRPTIRFTGIRKGASFTATTHYAFNANAFLNGLFQYNADRRQVSSNIRFNIIHHPLSDFFIVYNDLRDSQTGQVLERAVILKLTNLFNF